MDPGSIRTPRIRHDGERGRDIDIRTRQEEILRHKMRQVLVRYIRPRIGLDFNVAPQDKDVAYDTTRVQVGLTRDVMGADSHIAMKEHGLRRL